MDKDTRAALLQTSQTVKPRTAAKNWQVVRHSDMVSKALASQSWTMVVKALQENDKQIMAAKQELARAKARLAEIDDEIVLTKTTHSRSGGMSNRLSGMLSRKTDRSARDRARDLMTGASVKER